MVVEETISETGETILTIKIFKGKEPWRKIYLNWRALSPEAQTAIGIQDRHRTLLTQEPTGRVLLLKPLPVALKELAGALRPPFKGAKKSQ